MAEQAVEQITKEPTVKNKVKDPKKVENGKKLAAYHKRAKEALKKQEEEEASINNQKEGSSMDVNAWIPSLSFQTVLTLGSIALTAYSLFTRHKINIADLHVPAPTFKPPPVKNINEAMSDPTRENSLNDEWM